MENTILLADDDSGVAATVTRLLGNDCRVIVAHDGVSALAEAEANHPDLILLDVHMPGLNGWEVLQKLRRDEWTRTTPIIMLTGCDDEQAKDDGFGLGADDYVTKPFSVRELRTRVMSRLLRHSEVVGSNPLTRLPGAPTIRAEVENRIRDGRPFSFLLADIDRFKAYNDHYSCERGDRVILRTGEILREAMIAAGDSSGLLGHIGGDDFALVCEEQKAPLAAAFATMKFDEAVAGFYDPLDAARGWVESKDRSGLIKKHAQISLTVAGVSSLHRPLTGYADASVCAGDMKRWLKRMRDSGPSALGFDRRRGAI